MQRYAKNTVIGHRRDTRMIDNIPHRSRDSFISLPLHAKKMCSASVRRRSANRGKRGYRGAEGTKQRIWRRQRTYREGRMREETRKNVESALTMIRRAKSRRQQAEGRNRGKSSADGGAIMPNDTVFDDRSTAKRPAPRSPRRKRGPGKQNNALEPERQRRLIRPGRSQRDRQHALAGRLNVRARSFPDGTSPRLSPRSPSP